MAKMAVKSIFSPYFSIRVFNFHYTTSAINTSNSTFMVNYLMNSLGFSKQEAIVTSSKVSSLKSPKNPDSVVDFFINNGFTKTQLKRLVFSRPEILSSNVEKTLKPKLEAFQILGLTGSRLADVVSGCPDVFRRSLNQHLIPTLTVLKSAFGDKNGDNLALIAALKSTSWMLAPCARTNIPLNVALLQDYGLSVDQIKLFLQRKSRYIVLDPKWLQACLIRVENFGIRRDSAMFFHGIVALCSISEESLESRLQVYKSFGWTDSDILTMARKSPYTLVLSESRIRKSLNFFMKEVGYKPVDIATRSCVLTFSLEKRVIPRYIVVEVLKEKKLIKPNYAIFSCLNISNSTFAAKFVIPYKEMVPELYHGYMESVGSPLEAGK